MWVDLQLRRLVSHLDRPYRLYAHLDGEAVAHAHRFDEWFPGERVHHYKKLDHLAARICAQAADDDVLMFLDGDAFPIADLGEVIDAMLADHPLAAVKRTEIFGDPIPHPSFCVTTPRFWREIGATWAGGYEWRDTLGEFRTDTGANLYKLLEDTGVEWLPLLRTNKRDLHPVLFAVYADLVYHHGAGFRRQLTRPDQLEVEQETRKLAPGEHADRVRKRLTAKRMQRNRRLSMEVYEEARNDDEFWRRLLY
jgi:hypothetical protein